MFRQVCLKAFIFGTISFQDGHPRLGGCFSRKNRGHSDETFCRSLSAIFLSDWFVVLVLGLGVLAQDPLNYSSCARTSVSTCNFLSIRMVAATRFFCDYL